MLDPAGYCFDLRVIVLAGPFAKFSECVAIERASQDFRRTEFARQTPTASTMVARSAPQNHPKRKKKKGGIRRKGRRARRGDVEVRVEWEEGAPPDAGKVDGGARQCSLG